MRGTADVSADAASVLETDPSLRSLMGAGDGVAAGHRPVLPVLAVTAGAWEPPAAAALGAGTIALVVLAGALLRESPDGDAQLLGPGDLIEPWRRRPARWTACTPVRAAIIGDAFLEAVGPWPQAAARMLRRAAGGDDPGVVRMGGDGTGTAQDRLCALLWRLAIRWGRIEGDGVVLKLTLAPAMLARLAAVAPEEAAAAVAALAHDCTATRRADGTWLLRASGAAAGGDLPARRDDLRGRVAGGVARARDACETAAELLEESAAQRRLAHERRRR
jgi:hypothetical protein